jgi:2-polyprenyl-6-methoxyphenol hydroxylase-like FAD-dependent oxidoreductase
MSRFPTGLLVLGDAVCNLTPIYGQGMTVAALQATALSQQLTQPQRPKSHRLQRQIALIAGQAWALATGADLAFPQVPGHRGPATRFLGRYVARVQAAAAHDPTVGRAFLRVTSLVDPPQALFRPSILARAAAPSPHP